MTSASAAQISHVAVLPADHAVLTADGAVRKADLVLEGGGVKGIGLAGAVLTLTDAGYVFPRVAGTSAGAIAAALIAALDAAGQPLDMLKTYLDQVDYPRFMAEGHVRARLGVVGDAERLLVHMGLYNGDYLVEWLGGLLEQIGITTFKDLRTDDPGADTTRTDAQKYSLVVHTSDITRGRLVRLPWDYPAYGKNPDDERIVDAVRASMAIPFFFEPARFTAAAATVDGTSYQPGRVTWVDGGMLSNFPVEVFDRGDGAPSRWPTIGIKLSARASVVGNRPAVDGVVDETVQCLQTLLANADRYYVTPDKAARTLFIDNAGVKATDFHLTAQLRQTLFANGQDAAKKYLAAVATTE